MGILVVLDLPAGPVWPLLQRDGPEPAHGRASTPSKPAGAVRGRLRWAPQPPRRAATTRVVRVPRQTAPCRARGSAHSSVDGRPGSAAHVWDARQTPPRNDLPGQANARRVLAGA